MKRNLINTLQQWMESKERLPFYMTGIKGVGKTYLACEFAGSFFDSYLYLSFEHNKELAAYFNALPAEELLPALAEYFELPEETLLHLPFVFDEIYHCPEFFTNLLQLIKDNKQLYWIFLSSYDYLPEEHKQLLSCHTLYPMQFDEFLTAIGKDWYVEVITAHYYNRKKLPDIVHHELLSTFDEYLWIGGMPDVMNEYLNMESTVNVLERQHIQKQMLLYGMEHEAGEKTNYKCVQVYSTIDEQLNKPNQKFQFNLIRKGITYQMYKDSIDFLVRHHMLYRQDCLGKEEQQFKLFYPDFSLNYSARNNELTVVERQIRLQNYLYQTLKEKNMDCKFWEAKSQASIDFVLQNDTDKKYTLIEIKKEGKSKTKSMQSFAGQFDVRNVVRISGSNFVENDEFLNLPVYSVFCFENMIDK